ncbi:MAG: dTDP-4-dehydrorhamnose reductase [Bdellovibrionales bacterium]|nr:dTDP-4-dehydrorhamnose reductase [Bdellovibrionales bacterium]
MKDRGRLLVFGKNGQIGQAFSEILSRNRSDNVYLLGSQDCRVEKTDELERVLERIRPQLIVNCAAYTAVDKAETESDLAMSINTEAPGVMARWCAQNRAKLIHFSTDYVFNGNLDRPYLEQDPTGPLGAYGQSKLMGEKLIRQHLKAHLIFRISWVFSCVGNNFVKTMLRLGSERESLKIVSDQIGSPTFAPDVARAVLKVVGIDGEKVSDTEFPFGTYHLHNLGETTWFEFAQSIFAVAKSLGVALKVKEILPTTTAEFGAPAPRPLNSRMNMDLFSQTFGIDMPSWEQSLNSCITTLQKNSLL